MKISVNLILTFIIAFTFIRNMLIPIAFDDYVYAFMWYETDFIKALPSSERIASIQDIIISQWNHYFTWGGRVISHFFVQFFMFIGKEYFNIINTMMFVLLIWLINKISSGSNTFEKFNLIFIFIAIWICTAQLTFTTLWLSGTCNYMWMTIFQLIFLLPYISALRNNKHQKSFWIIPFGLIAGWSNEAGSLATVTMTLFILYFLKHQNKLEFWQIAGAITLILGCAILFAAPGNIARLHFSQPNFHWSVNLIIDYLKGPFFEILSKNFILILSIVYYFLKRKRTNFSINDVLIATFSLGGLIVPIVMLGSPQFLSHVGFSSTIFFIIASLMALEQVAYYPKIFKIMANIILIASSMTLLLCLYSDISIYKQMQTQFKMIDEHKNDECIYVSKLKYPKICEKVLGMRIPAYQLKYIGGIVPDENSFYSYYNLAFCKCYGLKNISTIG